MKGAYVRLRTASGSSRYLAKVITGICPNTWPSYKLKMLGVSYPRARHKGVWGNEGTAPLTLNVGIRWGVWLDSRLGRFISQPPGRGPVPGPGINYTGSREVLLQFVILVF